MKVQASIRALHSDREPIYRALQSKIDKALMSVKAPTWHYESRVKAEESFALKVESGRVPDPANLEDFFACTLVVPNSTVIPMAVAAVESAVRVRHRRPPSSHRTRKRPAEFVFDDLRLYCFRGNDGSRPHEPLDELTFEVQIKTFLQHAWGVATHDLSYKTDDIRWGKQRIVAHVRAAVEYAEISLLQAQEMSNGPGLDLIGEEAEQAANLVELLKALWPRDRLPANLKGLADTLLPIMREAQISLEALRDSLEAEFGDRSGLPLNLSPYGTIVQALLSHRRAALEAMLKDRRKKARILVTPEIALPAGFDKGAFGDRIVALT